MGQESIAKDQIYQDLVVKKILTVGQRIVCPEVDIGRLTASSVIAAEIHGITANISHLNVDTITIASGGGGGGGSGIMQLDGDSGAATGTIVGILGGSNINTSAAGSNVTINLVASPSVAGSLTAGTSISSGTSITAGTF